MQYSCRKVSLAAGRKEHLITRVRTSDVLGADPDALSLARQYSFGAGTYHFLAFLWFRFAFDLIDLSGPVQGE